MNETYRAERLMSAAERYHAHNEREVVDSYKRHMLTLAVNKIAKEIGYRFSVDIEITEAEQEPPVVVSRGITPHSAGHLVELDYGRDLLIRLVAVAQADKDGNE